MCHELDIPVSITYTVSILDEDIKTFMTQIGYSEDMGTSIIDKHKTKTNEGEISTLIALEGVSQRNAPIFDSITQTTQQTGYSLIFRHHYYFGRTFIHAISYRIKSDSTKVYFSRFPHIIFNQHCPNEVNVSLFKLTKIAFSDLLSKDNKKSNLVVLILSELVIHILYLNLPIFYGI